MGRATALREAVKTRFYPFVESRGFTRIKSDSIFTLFRRIEGQSVHVFDVQWDKYGAPRFVVNFGEAPASGVDLRGEHILSAQIETYHCTKRGRLQRRKGPYLRCWFQINKPLLEALKSMRRRYEPVEVVDQLIAAFPELEAWWVNKSEGEHLYVPVAG